MLALILVRKLRPIAIGSSSAWLMLAGMMARPRATSRAHELRRDEQRHRGAEALAVLLRPFGAVELLLAAHVLALGDVDHLLGDDAELGPLVLGDRLAVERALGLRRVREIAGEVLAGDVAVVDRLDRAAVVFLDAAALLDPFDAGALQPVLDVDRRRRCRCRRRWCRRPAAAARRLPPTARSRGSARAGRARPRASRKPCASRPAVRW